MNDHVAKPIDPDQLFGGAAALDQAPGKPRRVQQTNGPNFSERIAARRSARPPARRSTASMSSRRSSEPAATASATRPCCAASRSRQAGTVEGHWEARFQPAMRQPRNAPRTP